ncbi:hypothetical protein Q73A0000_12215 [Kaistella flava (ex Peng et al. 2021)]|uniref:Uncharacterized protein n=1 Tax=Kaistella flava (ex Peng et al. 2021) TaxID=2038776 RepID=A0A7M2Y9W9_9FLAO|nr:hypothetical protein [Kaistella flava (ex Peng et al. 2021)]QOW11067.1 hypothetical protein Q73A0000_12215 [Kaistella flava (ex Peng et al. 2021)]
MKKLLIFSLLFFSWFQNIGAQQNLVGSYHISSGNPDDGGYNWFLFDNNEFAMVTFGQIISGKWTQNENHKIIFKPYIPDQSLQVFGRYNPDINGSKILFKDLDINEKTFIATSTKEMQNILNEDANCLPYPVKKEFDHSLEKLMLSNCLTQNLKQNRLGFDYEIADNNDFVIIYYNSQMMLPEFKGEIVNSQLTLNQGSSSSPKRSISKTDESEIKKFVEQQKNYYSQTSFLSTKENRFGTISPEGIINFEENQLRLSHYIIDSKTGIYVLKSALDEMVPAEFKTLYFYKKLNFKKSTEPIKFFKKSLFQFQCN